MPHHRQVVQDDRDDIAHSWRDKACSMTVSAVCKRCNNEWMSDLEQSAKPMLEGMLHGHGRQLHAGGQRTLAAWALKTAMMVEHSQGASRHLIGAADYAHLFERLEPSSRVRMWMAAYGGDVITAMGSNFGLDTELAGGGLPDPDRGAREIWSATVSFGPVVVQLLGSDIAEVLQGFKVRVRGCHRLWPTHRSFTWMPRPALTEHELVGFAEGLVRERLRQLRQGG